MDCSKTTEFLHELNRMCVTAGECNGCVLYRRTLGKGNCSNFIKGCPERAVELVQEWSDQHPVKTRLSVFLETFPNAVMKSKGNLPLSCARLIFGFDECEKKSCAECWNTPIEGDNNDA